MDFDPHSFFLGAVAFVFACATFDLGIAFLIGALRNSTPDD